MATIFDRVVFCGRETTKGVSPFTATQTFTSTVTDVTNAITAAPTNPAMQAVKVRSVKLQPNVTAIDRPIVKGSMGNAPHLIGRKSMQVDLEIEFKGSGTAGTAPEYTPILEACGLSTTITANTSVAFAPGTTTQTLTQGCTLRVFYDGLLYEITGCAGTFTLDMSIGNILIAQVTLQGSYAAPVAAAVGDITTVPFDATAPIVGDVTDIISDGATIRTAALNFDAGNDVQEHYVTGNHVFSVANRAPTVSLTKDSIATAAEWNALTAGTDAALSASFTTGGVGNSLSFSAPRGRRTGVTYNERAERDVLDVAYNLYESTTPNSQFSFTFT